jgi:hypothetical protein
MNNKFVVMMAMCFAAIHSGITGLFSSDDSHHQANSFYQPVISNKARVNRIKNKRIQNGFKKSKR